jgi:hypothetical protein
MKKVLRLAAVCFFTISVISSKAQNFSAIPQETNLWGALGNTVTFHIEMTNNSSNDLTLAIIRTQNNIPVGWTSSICLDVCFLHTVDSVTTTSMWGSSPLAPSETRELKIIVEIQNNTGVGNIQIKVADFRNQSDFVLIDLEAATLATSVDINNNAPAEFNIEQNYPNPFNPSTKIRFTIPNNVISTEGRNLRDFSSSVSRRTSRNDITQLIIYDMLGNEITTLVNEQKAPGTYEVEFSSEKLGLSSGIYFYQLRSNGFIKTKKMILEK